MGGQTYGSQDWANLQTRSAAASAPTATPQTVYKSSSLDPYLDPKKIKVRESRNSAGNPRATPIILACDVTGSMADVMQSLFSTVLPALMRSIYDRKPVTDPHVMFMAYDDVLCHNDAPLQATQFEADSRIVDQLDKVYLVGDGGGNGSESSNLPWHFAAYHTSCDAFEKDGRKGFLFSFGDDGPPPDLTEDDLIKTYGSPDEVLASNADILRRLESMYHVFHLHLSRGYSPTDYIMSRWKAVLGERALEVSDHTKLGEVIVSTMQVLAGQDVDTVAKSWSGDTSLVVAKAIKDLKAGAVATQDSGQRVVLF